MDLAKRYRSELDRRKLHVELTEKGKGILENAPLPLQAQFIEQFEGLKTFEQTAILSSLQQVAEMMQTQSASRSGETDVLQLVTSSEVAKPAAWVIVRRGSLEGGALRAKSQTFGFRPYCSALTCLVL